MPATVALAGLSWLASLLAFAAIHRLAVVHAGSTAARWAVWFVALSPGALSLVLGYSDAFFLAALAWALVFAGRGQWAAAGAAAAVATASRPNGWIAAVAVVVVVARMDRSWRALVIAAAPSAVFLLGWFWYLDHATGDPFVFWSAKSAWEETSIVEWAGDPLTNRLEVFHVAWFAVALVFYVRRGLAPAAGVARHHGADGRAGVAVRCCRPRTLRGAGLPDAGGRRRLALAPSTELGNLGRARMLGNRSRILRSRRGRTLVVAVTPIARCRQSSPASP